MRKARLQKDWFGSRCVDDAGASTGHVQTGQGSRRAKIRATQGPLPSQVDDGPQWEEPFVQHFLCRDEMVQTLAATDQYKEEMACNGVENRRRRIRGLVLLLRYSGTRIGDAVNFSTDQLEGNRLFVYTQKNGVPVNALLPEFVLAALDTTPRVTEKFLFWSGKRKTRKHCTQLADTSAQTLYLFFSDIRCNYLSFSKLIAPANT
jgi:hypothetical protein